MTNGCTGTAGPTQKTCEQTRTLTRRTIGENQCGSDETKKITRTSYRSCSGPFYRRTCRNYEDYSCVKTTTTECSANAACPTGTGEISSTSCSLFSCDNNTIITLKETSLNQFLDAPTTATGDYYTLNINNFLETFYQTHSDNYDMLLVFPQASITNSFSYRPNTNIQGIGGGNWINPHTKKLINLVGIDRYWAYSANVRLNNPNPTDPGGVSTTDILHELGHGFCCYINPITLGGDGSHWPTTIDLFYGNLNEDELMAYGHLWTLSADGTASCHSNPQISKFSKLSLYLMGLVSPNDVPPFDSYSFQKLGLDAPYNIYGPACNQQHVFTGTTKITIQDIINTNGPRIPGVSSSTKNFKIGVVLAVPYSSTIDEGFKTYSYKFANLIYQEWPIVTDHLSTLSFCSDGPMTTSYDVTVPLPPSNTY